MIVIILSGGVVVWVVLPSSIPSCMPYMSIDLLRLSMVTRQSISVPLDIASVMSLKDGNASILESFLIYFAASTSLLEYSDSF